MARTFSRFLAICALTSVLLLAQTQRFTAVHGVVSPRLRNARDLGRLDPAQKISFATLGLRRTAAQQAALDTLLTEMQDPASPNYHQWLSAEEFAQRFGASASQIAQVTTWLASQGLTVEDIARGRNWIIFSGTAAQIEQAFHTALHQYDVDGETHFSISADPSVPAALAPLVLGFRGLDDFRIQPAGHYSKRNAPQFNPPNSDPTPHVLTPGDIANIYDLGPLLSQGIDGTGQSVAIVGASQVYISDLDEFRGTTGLPAQRRQSVIYGPNPGINGAEGEADIDLDWVGAVAQNATVIFVQSEDPFVALQYAIDQNFAPVISVSFAACEASASGFAPEITEALAQQANAQGITILVATGDQASAACDRDPSTGDMPAVASQGPSVNYPATLPEITAVGGTMFHEGNGNYWSFTNASNGTSALGYIPEVVWNETASIGTIVGGTGGPSILFGKPAWQSASGVPNDGARDVPDISLDSAAQHDPYLIFTDNGQLGFEGGTSVATPIFAGMVVLLNQYLVSKGIQAKPGVGNINPALYRLAHSTPQAFHDITQGNNFAPCQIGTPGCPNGTFGYSAGPGYDLATGLGTVDAAALITHWTTSASTGPANASITLSASPTNLTVAGTTTLTATVTAANNSITPSGSVSFVFGSQTLGAANLTGSGSTATARLQIYGSQLPVGSDIVTAIYAGNASLNGGSSSVTLNVTLPVAAAAIVPTFAPNPVYEQQTDADGYGWFFTVTLTETAGVAASLSSFTFAGTDYSSSIPSFFGASAIAAHGTLQAALRAKITTIPSSITLGFGGIDNNGNSWSQQISVPFYGRQKTAAIALSSSPAIVKQNPNAPSDCQYLQQLNIQEQNGYGVTFTRFTGGGLDLTKDIQDFFGSLRLAPFGALEAEICWTGINPPETLNYEIDALDSTGNQVVATGSALFQGPVGGPGALSLSTPGLALSARNSLGSASAQVNVSVPLGQAWSLAMLPDNRNTSWLLVSPLSGTGPAVITITASGSGLANGVYLADLAFQSTNTMPQFVNLPVKFTVGQSSSLSIQAVSNGASFQTGAAPGMILSVFGSNLAPSTAQASKVPLPFTLVGVSATVDGMPAPLYYVSSTQLNIQIPYETPAGPAILAVNNGGQLATYIFDVAFSAPGIFVDSQRNLVPYPSGKRGQTLTLFVTGEGDVTPPLATGASPGSSTAAANLPAPVLPAKLLIGGVSAKIDFIGVPPGLAGVTQVNFTVPSNAPVGVQPVEFSVGGVNSPPANFNVSQ